MALSPFSLIIHLICMLVGSSIGIGVSFIVNCALIEISKSKIFSIYFAVLFLIIGIYILIRSLRSLYTNFQNPDYIQVNQKENFRHRYLFCLSLIIILASIFGFLLHSEFLIKLHYLLKVPIYAILGIAVSFSLVISIIDIINFCFHLIQPKDNKPPINSTNQIIPLIIVSCFMGMLFGIVFGIMDMEDVSTRHIKEYLMKEENYCIPIGVIMGAIAGLFVSGSDKSEAAQEQVTKEFSPLKQEDEVEI